MKIELTKEPKEVHLILESHEEAVVLRAVINVGCRPRSLVTDTDKKMCDTEIYNKLTEGWWD